MTGKPPVYLIRTDAQQLYLQSATSHKYMNAERQKNATLLCLPTKWFRRFPQFHSPAKPILRKAIRDKVKSISIIAAKLLVINKPLHTHGINKQRNMTVSSENSHHTAIILGIPCLSITSKFILEMTLGRIP